MTATGRNDPCQCGSGKKYKKCCSLSATVTTLPAYSQSDRLSAIAALMRFAERDEFKEHREAVLAEAMGPVLNLPPAEHLAALVNVVMMALMYDYRGKNGIPLAEVYLKRFGGRLTPGERRYVDRMLASHFDLHRVVSVEPGVGLVLEHFTDEIEFEVEERTASQTLRAGHIIGVRIMEGPSGVAHMDGDPLLFTALQVHSVLARPRRQPPLTRSIALARIYAEILAEPTPQMRTRDGDPVEPHLSIFDVLDGPRLHRALASSDDVIAEDPGAYIWLDGQSILATMHVRNRRFEIETLSRAAADRARTFVEGLAPHALRYRLARIEGATQAISVMAGLERLDNSDGDEDMQKYLAEFLDRHYRDWLDIPVPALGNRTPRHAARLKTVRPMLLALLIDLQAAEDIKPAGAAPRYDFDWMYEELDLR